MFNLFKEYVFCLIFKNQSHQKVKEEKSFFSVDTNKVVDKVNIFL